MDEVTIKGLLGIGAMVLMLEGPLTWLRVSNFFREWKKRKAPASRRLASIDWLDPEIRRN